MKKNKLNLETGSIKPFRHLVLSGLLLGACLTSLFAKAPENKPGQPEPRLSGEVFRVRTETKGSPFFYDHWSPGTVILVSGAEIDDHLLMYNGFIDELIYQHPRTYEIIIADKKLVRGFILKSNGREDVFKKFSHGPWSGIFRTGTYFRVLHEGDISLLVHQKVKKAGEVAEYTDDGPLIKTKLEANPAYYIVLNDGRVFFIKRFNRRAFYKILPENREEVRQAFRNSSLRPQTDGHRAELVKNLDKLIHFNLPEFNKQLNQL
jgi:hypothetical protein